MRKSSTLIPLALGLLLGCSQASPEKADTVPPQKASAIKVAKIIFIGQKEACDCTRKRIEDSWSVLQTALGPEGKVPVESIQEDGDAARAEPFKAMKPFMVLPAVYFLDSSGTLIEMLQGEITPEQIAQIMGEG